MKWSRLSKSARCVFIPGSADPRLVLSFVRVGSRFNLAFSVSNRDRASLAEYTVRELAKIQDSLLEVGSQLNGQQRKRLLIINGHVGMLRSVHETILAQGREPSKAEEPQFDPNSPRLLCVALSLGAPVP
jgi:hypothetical protein